MNIIVANYNMGAKAARNLFNSGFYSLKQLKNREFTTHTDEFVNGYFDEICKIEEEQRNVDNPV